MKLWLILAAAVAAAAVLVGRTLPPFAGPSLQTLTPEEQAAMAQMRRVLTKDDILPIYHPRFVSAAAATLAPDELVMGVAMNGQAKAYPITVLNGREMVNDELAGVPILVTW